LVVSQTEKLPRRFSDVCRAAFGCRGVTEQYFLAFVTAGILVLPGGVPICVNGAVAGAVGVAGLSKETDAPKSQTPRRRCWAPHR
jgi:hypothetical protein